MSGEHQAQPRNPTESFTIPVPVANAPVFSSLHGAVAAIRSRLRAVCGTKFLL